MVTTYQSTLLIVTMMLTSGCVGLTNQDSSPDVDKVDCNINPNHNDCFKTEIIENDCNSKEVFTGTYCRIMVRPENLNYGEKSILLIVGQEMQNLTPSFLGDGPVRALGPIGSGLPGGLPSGGSPSDCSDTSLQYHSRHWITSFHLLQLP